MMVNEGPWRREASVAKILFASALRGVSIEAVTKGVGWPRFGFFLYCTLSSGLPFIFKFIFTPVCPLFLRPNSMAQGDYWSTNTLFQIFFFSPHSRTPWKDDCI